jgi:hypothetical protein
MRPGKARQVDAVLALEHKATSTTSRYMTDRQARAQVARARGGDRGQGHRWTSETAHAAALARWARSPVSRRVGVRLGNPRHTRRPVDHQGIRDTHANRWVQGIKYVAGSWWRKVEHPSGGYVIRCVSERTALKRLGYIKTDRKGLVPTEIRPLMPGTTLARLVRS